MSRRPEGKWSSARLINTPVLVDQLLLENGWPRVGMRVKKQPRAGFSISEFRGPDNHTHAEYLPGETAIGRDFPRADSQGLRGIQSKAGKQAVQGDFQEVIVIIRSMMGACITSLAFKSREGTRNTV